MNGIGWAVKQLQNSSAVRRCVWPIGTFIYLVPAAKYPAQTEVAKTVFSNTNIGNISYVPYKAYIAYMSIDNDIEMWNPSHEDILAIDYIDAIVEDLSDLEDDIDTSAFKSAIAWRKYAAKLEAKILSVTGIIEAVASDERRTEPPLDI